MMSQGKRQLDISRELGLAYSTVHDAYKRAMEKGLIRGRPLRAADNMLVKRGVRSGKMKELLNMLTTEEIDWLVRVTPEGSPLSIGIAAIIRDAFDEDRANEDMGDE